MKYLLIFYWPCFFSTLGVVKETIPERVIIPTIIKNGILKRYILIYFSFNNIALVITYSVCLH